MASCIFFWFYIKKIILSGDVETNPGPQSKRCQEFSICHWNLNGIATLSLLKVSLLKAYITTYNYDVICLSETYLDSSILSDDNNLEILGYDPVRADHPCNNKRGGVCVYYRNSLPLEILDIFYLQECIVFELKIGNKFCKIVSLYRSPNQSQDEFETLANKLELILDKIFETNPFLVIALGDFNAKLSRCYKNEKITTESSKIANLTSQYGLKQIINEPTHIRNNSSSCIDLVFTSQPNLIMESGVHSSHSPTNLAPRTDQSLTSINFSQDDILKIIQNLNPNKADGPDKIRTRMIKICGKSLCKSSEMIFNSCIVKGEFLSEWKKANVVPVHKKATINR